MSDKGPSLKDIANAAAADRPHYFDDPVIDDLLALMLELGEDICVLRDRLATAQELGQVADASIDGYEPDEAEIGARLERHTAFMNELFQRIVAIAGK